MKIAIVQAGVGDTGKTTTIRLAYTMLLGKYPEATVQDLLDNDFDFRVILKIQSLQIGMESYGDPWKREGRIEKSLALFVEVGCDVILCASRSRGKTVETVQCLQDEGYEIEWRNRNGKTHPALQEDRNRLEAKYMVDKIEGLFLLSIA